MLLIQIEFYDPDTSVKRTVRMKCYFSLIGRMLNICKIHRSGMVMLHLKLLQIFLIICAI